MVFYKVLGGATCFCTTAGAGMGTELPLRRGSFGLHLANPLSRCSRCLHSMDSSDPSFLELV